MRSNSFGTFKESTMKPDSTLKTRFEDCVGEVKDEHATIVETVINMIGGKWKVLIVWHLGFNKVLRFGELRRKLPGITQRMLTLALREMERDGLIVRKVYAEVPPHVEYSLSDEGADLKRIYCEVASWGLRHEDLLRAARENRVRRA
jgi:DNA-binding HxlR family transcriptional regulator